MVIGSCGFGATGSSVLTDLLREYDDIQVYDNFEFHLAYRVDGLQDLEYHLMKQHSRVSSGDYAIKRFLYMANVCKTPFINKPCDGKIFKKLSEEYIKNITQLEYKGMETVDVLSGNVCRNFFALASKKIILPKIVEKITRKRSFLWPCRTLYYSIKPGNFYEETKKYTNNVIKAMGADIKKPVCLDQPFEGDNPKQSMKFFDDPYAVVIDRDPRDLYLEYKYSTDPNAKFFPYENVDDFIIYYKKLRENADNKDDDRVLHLKFEELIYEYDNSIRKIEEFLKLKEHKCKKEIFEPNRSINNTQLIRKHPDDLEDIRKIEKELKDYLFPFEKYSNVEFTGQSFYGAARKNFKGTN